MIFIDIFKLHNIAFVFVNYANTNISFMYPDVFKDYYIHVIQIGLSNRFYGLMLISKRKVIRIQKYIFNKVARHVFLRESRHNIKALRKSIDALISTLIMILLFWFYLIGKFILC